MKQSAITAFALTTLLAGCDGPENISCLTAPVVIQSIHSLPFQPSSRSAEEDTPFREGDNIAFFSRGGIEADNVLLIYHNHAWEHNGALEWNTSGSSATLSAYYPPFDPADPELYDDRQLKDILYASQEVGYGSPIQLHFGHLFSKITFQADEALNPQIEHITFTPSAQAESIDPITAAITIANTPPEPFQIARQDDRAYSFLVPPAENSTISLDITTDQGTLSLTTAPQTYKSGYQYTYRLITKGQDAGIYTAEDFIAFSHLINGEEYEGRSLEEFGQEENGTMTYFLCNDIEFTEEESTRVKPIGFSARYTSDTSYSFNDSFDGKGHTLSNLQIETVDRTLYHGLFGYIGDNGTVKNLYVENSSYGNTESENRHYAGIIAGRCEGTIINCHVESCTIEYANGGYASGITGWNSKGTIVNCSVTGMSFICSQAGGICSENNGKIINSFTSQCQFSDVQQAGGICWNSSSQTQILNCYVNNSAYPANGTFGELAYRITSPLTISHCYYPETTAFYPIYNGNNNIDKSYLYTYGAEYTVSGTGDTLPDVLGTWVSSNQENYADYTLLYWTDGEGNAPAIHLQLP